MTLQEAVDTLRELRDADEVAAFLANEGIKGYRHEMEDCPIAVYLDKKTGHVVIVDGVSARIPHYDGTRVTLPFPVKVFTMAFDNGKYPDLNVRNAETEVS